MKHTPGPWRIDQNAKIIAGKSVLGRVYCGDIFPNEDLPECTANAQLIAAAPETAAERDRLKELNKELTEALEIVLAADLNSPYSVSIFSLPQMNFIKSAIAKAKSL